MTSVCSNESVSYDGKPCREILFSMQNIVPVPKRVSCHYEVSVVRIQRRIDRLGINLACNSGKIRLRQLIFCRRQEITSWKFIAVTFVWICCFKASTSGLVPEMPLCTIRPVSVTSYVDVYKRQMLSFVSHFSCSVCCIVPYSQSRCNPVHCHNFAIVSYKI